MMRKLQLTDQVRLSVGQPASLIHEGSVQFAEELIDLPGHIRNIEYQAKQQVVADAEQKRLADQQEATEGDGY